MRRSGAEARLAPAPFRQHPRAIATKYRRGIAQVNHWMSCGILRIGAMNPDKRILGTMTNMFSSIVCCCVLASDEINSSRPRVAMAKGTIDPNMNTMFPLKTLWPKSRRVG